MLDRDIFRGLCLLGQTTPFAEEVFSGSGWGFWQKEKYTLHFSHKCNENIH